jgi:hypothetical protein
MARDGTAMGAGRVCDLGGTEASAASQGLHRSGGANPSVTVPRHYQRVRVPQALATTLVAGRSSAEEGPKRRRRATIGHRSTNRITVRASGEFKAVDGEGKGVDLVLFFEAIASRFERHAPAWRHSLTASSKLSA